jgi:transcriptional regulator with PAS, ATPase and Fis domain
MDEANKSAIPASFVCEKCKGTPSMDQIFQSIATYGLIWLTNDENTWIGFNCPLCEKPWTNIKKFKHEEVRPFGLEMGKRTAYDFGTPAYHSFPFRMDQPVKGPYFAGPYMKQLELPVDKIGEEILEIFNKLPVDQLGEEIVDSFDSEEDLIYSRKLYSSYPFEYKAFGPAIAIWWYRDEDIEKLAAYESESGLRTFPRFRLYDNLYSEIDRFCWQERLHIDFRNSLNLDWEITHILSNPAKKDLTKTFDFMHILDMPHLDDILKYITRKNQFIDSPSSWAKLPRQTADIGSKTCCSRKTASDHEEISSVVWANFTKDYVQDLLKKLSDKFIDEYIALSERTDFTFSAVWELKEKYLSDLKKAIKSRRERKKLERSANEHHRNRVREAEKCFPGVEIISCDSEIDELKIWISNLSKVDTNRKAFLLLGERGTGKGVFAEAFHEASGRNGKLTKFDCGDREDTLFKSALFGHAKGAFTGADRIHKGALEEAGEGTIFIDEIGNLSMSLQAAMLGFLQDWEFQPLGAPGAKPVKAMVVLATNMDLEAEIENGKFRADLYDRISSFKHKIPPLRNRRNDIPILFHHFIKKHDGQRHNDPPLEEFTATSDCINALKDFYWPGNVRQLEGLVAKIIMTRTMNEDRSPIDLSDLPDWLSSDSKSKDPVHPKSNKSTLIGEKKYNYLPEKDSVLIEDEQDGMTRVAVAEKYGVDVATVIRRYSKIRKKAQS